MGILPLCLLSLDTQPNKCGVFLTHLRTLLGFACGGLLADVFLHILPEAFRNAEKRSHTEVNKSLILVVTRFIALSSL